MKKLALSLLFLSHGALAGATLNLENVLTELEKKEKALKSIRFEFSQDINFTEMGPQPSIKGEATFASAGKMKVSKTEPDKQITVSNGKKIWVYNPAYGQVWEGALKNWIHSAALPKGMIPFNRYIQDLKKNFKLGLKDVATDNADRIWIEARPKNPELGYELDIAFSSQSWLPVETIYRSDSGEVVTKLSRLEENPALPANAFQFTPPAGTDVIPLD